ncbi:hypothetical protein [Microbacterium sp. Leaf320]|uniref:hypothetical protein n=1 Tax=Microbacterium sp. Leaf320 TaxID=1736334 RepID=UPI0006F715EE|nr:hypothetical protein [Microbacterium sp. Leaf320]KQQ66036.1 hypothetical protein ASF63_11980 [Microbacterium sp. Leaf320]
MPTPTPPSEHALRVRRTASLSLSSASLALTLLTAIPIALVLFGFEETAVLPLPIELVRPSHTIAVATGAVGLVLGGNLPLEGVPRPRLPVQLGVAALLTAGTSMVLLAMPVLLMVASMLAGLLTMF